MQQTKRKIKASDIVQDVRSGRTDLEIMARHELSPKELDRVLGQLVRLDLLSERELQERTSPSVQSEPHETTCRPAAVYIRKKLASVPSVASALMTCRHPRR